MTRADPGRVLRLLQLLAAGLHPTVPSEVASDDAHPTVLVLVDRWDAVLAGADPLTGAALQEVVTERARERSAVSVGATAWTRRAARYAATSSTTRSRTCWTWAGTMPSRAMSSPSRERPTTCTPSTSLTAGSTSRGRARST